MKRLLSFALSILLVFSFALPASAAGKFSDVPENAWYTNAVNYCAENNYMSGIGNGLFDPNGKVSRAQMAQILYNFAGCPDVSNVSNPFNDVPNNAWYTKAVKFARSTGIVNGTSATTYSPNAYITREQVAVMLMGYYKSSGKTVSIDLSVLDKFTDTNKISSWAKNAIAWAVENKIMSGIGNGKLDPKGTCTRAQLAQFIKNYWGIKDNEPGEVNPPVVEPDLPTELPDIPGFPADGKFEPLPKDWLPEGGYFQGGRKYNQFGIDITGVDGVPSTEDITVMKLINDYRVSKGLTELKWSQHAQIMSEIRAREANYIYNSTKYVEYGTPHVRPNGSAIDAMKDTANVTDMITGNELMIAETKADEWLIDPDMANIGKIINKTTPWFGIANENLADGFTDPAKVFNAWVKSPGHEAAFVTNFVPDSNGTGYFAVDFHNATVAYNAYGIVWTNPPKYDPSPNPGDEWYPGQGVRYDRLGFELSDIPYEYPDWILRDPEMDIEFYGPTDHDINSLNAWLVDNGVDEYSDLMYQVKAHFFCTLDMDDYVKFMCCKSYPYHYTRLSTLPY